MPSLITLKPQNFPQLMIAGALSILLSYITLFYKTLEYRHLLTFAQLAAGVYMISGFIQYLSNYDSQSSIFWFKINLVWAVVSYIFFVSINIFNESYFHSIKLIHIGQFGYYFFKLLGIIIAIMEGISLQKINNDKVGFLKQFGIWSLIAMPIFSILFTICVIYRAPIWIIATMLLLISSPNIFIMFIFYKAYLFTQRFADDQSV